MTKPKLPSARLTRRQVNEIVDAEAAYRRAKRAFEDAEFERDAVRSRYRDRLPIGEDVEVHGVVIRITRGSTGERFSLSEARKAGYKLPVHLRRFVSAAHDTYRWTITPAGRVRKTAPPPADEVARIAA
jgi:hypothetical protein